MLQFSPHLPGFQETPWEPVFDAGRRPLGPGWFTSTTDMVSLHSEKQCRCRDSRKDQHLRMAAAQRASPSPTPSSPGLEGYDSALEEVVMPRLRTTSRGDESVSSDNSNRTIRTPPRRVSLIGACKGACGYTTSSGHPWAVY